MTFYEAAVEILRSLGRPLHYKKITELAIKQSMLSHVGKTPELTMSTRLNQEVRKDNGSSLVILNRPGVFALRAWRNEKIPDTIEETVCLTPSPEAAQEDQTAQRSTEGRRRLRRRRREERQGTALSTETVDSVQTEDESVEQVAEPRAPLKENTFAWPEMSVGEVEGLDEALVQFFRQHPYRTNILLDELIDGVHHRDIKGLPKDVAMARVNASIVLSNMSKKLRGKRPLFVGDEGWHLSEQGLLGSTLTREQSLVQLSDALVADSELTVAQHLLDLPFGAFALLVQRLFESLGYARIVNESSEHDWSEEAALFNSIYRAGAIEMKALLVLLSKEQATSVDLARIRTLGQRKLASRLVIVTRGESTEELLAQCCAASQQPVVLFDRPSLAKQLVSGGFGTKTYKVDVTLADPDFFRRLKGG